jgi:putative DNA methylase
MIFEGASTEGFEPDARLTAMWLRTLAGPTGKAGEGETAEESVEEDENSSGKKEKWNMAMMRAALE